VLTDDERPLVLYGDGKGQPADTRPGKKSS
jgi:hypothetical protein